MNGAIDLYGLRVAWRVRGLAKRSRTAASSPRLPPVEDAGAPTGERPVDLMFDVQAGNLDTEAAVALDGDEFRPSFFQGNVRGFARDGEILILAPAARVTITRDGKGVSAVVDPATLGERGFVNTTLVVALSLALRHHGLFHLHAGALVRGDGRRVVVLGEGGSGKTTVTLALLDAGSLRLGDDTLFFGARGGRVRLFAFPRPFHLGPATACAFPALATDAAAGDAKLDVPLDALPGRPVAEIDPPDVVLFPRVTGDPTTHVTPLSMAEAFGRALSSCALVVADGLGQKAEQLALLRELLAGARAFELALGADWLAAPEKAAALVPWDG